MRKSRILSLLLAVAVTATMLVAVPLTASAEGATVENLKTIEVATILYADDWIGLEVNDDNSVKTKPTTGLSAKTLYDADRILCIGATGDPADNKGNSDLGGRHYFNSVRIKGTGQIAFKVNPGAEVTVYTEKHSTRYLNAGTTDGGSELGQQNTNTNSFTFTHTDGGLVYLTSNSSDDQLYLGAISVKYPNSETPGISVSPSSKTILVGDSFKIFTNIQNQGEAHVSWSSETDGIVDLESQTDESVTVKGKSSGSTNSGSTIIKATINVGGQDYTASCAVTVEKVYNITFDISEVEEAEGKAPNAIKVKVGDPVTIPENRTLYVEGKTLTAWKDDAGEHAVGTEYTPSNDVTMTPVFTENKAKLGDEETTVKFEFGTDNGAPEYAIESNPDRGILVAQAKIGENTIDVKMGIDATPETNGTKGAANQKGKFNNVGKKDNAQINAGTYLTFPAVGEATIVIEKGGNCMVNGKEYKAEKDQSQNTPIKTTSFGKITIVQGSFNSANNVAKNTPWTTNDPNWNSISITYPKITGLTGEQGTDSGSYAEGEKGVIRFFQECKDIGNIQKYGFIFADKNGNYIGGGDYEVKSEKGFSPEDNPGFYTDLYNISKGEDGPFHAKAYVVLDSGEVQWAEVNSASVKWENVLTSYNEPSASE